MNKGCNGAEIAEMIKFPPELDQQFYVRAYYGTLKHNSRAVSVKHRHHIQHSAKHARQS
jgi:alkyl sulfatase BDS1-like metallo-beta-lactamase superfamily hydrolase